MHTVRIKEVFSEKADYPARDEVYTVGQTEDDRFFFAWGPDYPQDGEVPSKDILDGESGISYHDTLNDALDAMKSAVNAIESTR